MQNCILYSVFCILSDMFFLKKVDAFLFWLTFPVFVDYYLCFFDGFLLIYRIYFVILLSYYTI